MASDFDTLLDSFVVKPEIEANNGPSGDAYLLQSSHWKNRNILVHEESLSFLVAQKRIDDQSYDVESYIITPELKGFFRSAGFEVNTRTLYLWKDDEGQHGIAMINTDSQAPICVKGRQYMSLATTNWYQFESVKVDGKYDYLMKSVTVKSEPSWRAPSYREMLKEAISDRMVDSKDHPVVQGLINQGSRASIPPVPKRKTSNTNSIGSGTPIPSGANDVIDDILDD